MTDGLFEVGAEERQKMLDRMKVAKDMFYVFAQQVGQHQFLEFAGFIGEYIVMCEEAHSKGIDFVSDFGRLPFHDYRAGYLGEKMNCIYGRWFEQNPKLRKVFSEVFFGEREYPFVHQRGEDGEEERPAT